MIRFRPSFRNVVVVIVLTAPIWLTMIAVEECCDRATRVSRAVGGRLFALLERVFGGDA